MPWNAHYLMQLAARGKRPPYPTPEQALWEAVRQGHAPDLQSALDHGASPAALDGNGRTLWHAVLDQGAQRGIAWPTLEVVRRRCMPSWDQRHPQTQRSVAARLLRAGPRGIALVRQIWAASPAQVPYDGLREDVQEAIHHLLEINVPEGWAMMAPTATLGRLWARPEFARQPTVAAVHALMAARDLRQALPDEEPESASVRVNKPRI